MLLGVPGPRPLCLDGCWGGRGGVAGQPRPCLVAEAWQLGSLRLVVGSREGDSGGAGI